MLTSFMLLAVLLPAPSAVLASAVAMPATLAAPIQQDETVRDFRKYFRRAKDTWERVEYIQALKGIEDPKVAQLLLPITHDEDSAVAAAAVEVLAALPTAASRAGLLLVVEKGKPKDDLPIVLQAAGVGPWPEFAELTRAHLSNKNPESRLWATVAAGRFGDTVALPTLADIAFNDKLAVCRVAAIEAIVLLGVGFEEVVGPALVACLDADELAVQSAACVALRTIRVRAAIAPLVDLLEHGEGRILSDVYPTLIELTDLQYLDNPKIWRSWWSRAEESYKLLSSAEIKSRRAARAKTNEIYVPSRQAATFAGVATPSHSMVFVIDVSGSMEQYVVDREVFRKLGFTRFEKIEVVRREVISAIESLESYVKFNIIAFASDTRHWRKKLSSANSLNKRSALDFVRKLKPIGGASSGAMAAAGLVGSAGVQKGRTNTFGALCEALGYDPAMSMGVGNPVSGSVKSSVDTVFFLSDGIPSEGLLVDPDDILNAITELNRFRRVVIHTVAIGDFQKDFMIDLARQNGGQYRDLGR
ncbi:MAG: hypothetical protein COB96_02315 [Planctomycetota bacterium]|nr:MAG: hypothetical protein COB96_02315 [Planctomycetota bacterium]